MVRWQNLLGAGPMPLKTFLPSTMISPPGTGGFSLEQSFIKLRNCRARTAGHPSGFICLSTVKTKLDDNGAPPPNFLLTLEGMRAVASASVRLLEARVAFAKANARML